MDDADSDHASRRRDSHYNQQRSSWHSSRPPSHSHSHSRPTSGQLTRAYTLSHPPELDDGDDNDHDDDDDGYDNYHDHVSRPQSPDRASPAPNVPRLPQRNQRNQRNHSPASSGPKRWSRTPSRLGGATIEQLLFSRAHRRDPAGPSYDDNDDYDGLDEVAPPPPIQNPNEAPRYLHHYLEEERSAAHGFPPGRTSPSSSTALPAIARHGPDAKPSYNPLATELYTISYLVFFAIFGTLARLGVQWLTFYPGAPSTFPVLWANFAGTLVMGFLSQDQRLFRQEWGRQASTPHRTPSSDHEKALEQKNSAAAHAKAKKTIPLYIGLATGFCGSFTSFSSFMRDVFLAFLNDLRYPDADADAIAPRNGGYSFMAGLAVVIITIAVCYAALKVGAHMALLLDSVTPTLPFRFTRTVIDPAVVVLAWGVWLGAVFMAIWPPDRHAPNETWRGQAIFACVFAPLGCLLRFYVSLKLNPISPSFPLGTFAVNIFGTAVLGMAWDLQHVHIRNSGPGGGALGCQVLQGIMDGFDGCLTTVSTWVLEIDTLKRGHAWKYAFASILAGLCILLVVMGSVRWTVGWSAVACVTSRSW